LRRYVKVMEFAEHDLKGFMEGMAKPFSIPEVKCLMQQLLSGRARQILLATS
jgi:cell division cycle 2-like protein